MFSIITASKLTQTVSLTSLNFSTTLLLRRFFVYIFSATTSGSFSNHSFPYPSGGGNSPSGSGNSPGGSDVNGSPAWFYWVVYACIGLAVFLVAYVATSCISTSCNKKKRRNTMERLHLQEEMQRDIDIAWNRESLLNIQHNNDLENRPSNALTGPCLFVQGEVTGVYNPSSTSTYTPPSSSSSAVLPSSSTLSRSGSKRSKNKKRRVSFASSDDYLGDGDNHPLS